MGGKKLFLLGVFRRRLEYPAHKRAVREQQSLFGANVVLIEDKASGTQLIQELIEGGCYGVTRYHPTLDKIMRLHAQTAMIENGFVHLPETAPWLAEYLHEVTLFPKGRHDDQVDSTAQFLDWCKLPMPSWGIFEATRNAAEGFRVRLCAPLTARAACKPSRAGCSRSARTVPSRRLRTTPNTCSVPAGPRWRRGGGKERLAPDPNSPRRFHPSAGSGIPLFVIAGLDPRLSGSAIGAM